jgi:amylosucrase
VYNSSIHQQINAALKNNHIDIAGADNPFYTRIIANADAIYNLYSEIYSVHPAANNAFIQLTEVIIQAYKTRSGALKKKDLEKENKGNWYLSNEITGMSLYVDRFCGDIKILGEKLSHFEKLGVNLLHLLPVFESPAGESDGGYAVSDFRKVDQRFGTLQDLKSVREKMDKKGMYLMQDIVLNHTSRRHEWAEKARQGDAKYQDYFYMFDDRVIPDEYECALPEIFPESAPGNFTWVPECSKWVMTVFHNYQWDLNFSNPAVLVDMLDNIFFYANLGVDILRIDAPAFIWKQLGTNCQNLPQAHTLLRLIKQCVIAATPGMAILGEAIVSPEEIMKYFGTGEYLAKECDFAYNATQMALQWDMLATGDTRVMLAAQPGLLKKPFGASWITYTRCHDDIGLAYDDHMIRSAGYEPYLHRKYLKEYYEGIFPGSPSKGALFSSNPKTGDARISGTLASLCGLEKAIEANDSAAIDQSVNKILLMQAHSFFLGGIPMLFYGDELGYTNDYSYLDDPGKSYDNRWMHRPVIDWEKNKKLDAPGTIEYRIFAATKKLISIRKKLTVISDYKNLSWLHPFTIYVAAYVRTLGDNRFYGIFNFSHKPANISWATFKVKGTAPVKLYDHFAGKEIIPGTDEGFLTIEGYGFYLFENVRGK